jgi:hypothetical protein
LKAQLGIAEARFRLRNIEDEQIKLDLVASSMPKECLGPILSLVTNPSEDNPCESIKKRLYDQHQLMVFQRVEKLFAMEALGGQEAL